MKNILVNDIKMLSYPFDGSGNIFGFTTTRQGGISGGNYSSLNLGAYSGDDVGNVQENRRRLCRAVGIMDEKLFLPHQVHGVDIVHIDESFLSLSVADQQKRLSEKDAVITSVKNICIGVTTADCVPVLLFCPQRKIAAAIHAGWKGTAGRIASLCVRYMQKHLDVTPENLYAVICPSISVDRFEVGEEVVDRFLSAGYDSGQVLWSNSSTGKSHIDLWNANRSDLEQAGVLSEKIEIAGVCTRTCCSEFFSARKLGVASGRIVSGIVMR